MLSKEQLQLRLDELNKSIEVSKTSCENNKAELEKQYANHNVLLGAQILAKQLLEDIDKPQTQPQEQSQAQEPQAMDSEGNAVEVVE